MNSEANSYEKFRNVLIMNLCNVLSSEKLTEVLSAIDTTLNDYDIQKKNMDIIKVGEVPEVVKYYIASKAVANLSSGTLKQYTYKLTNFFKKMNKTYADITANDIRIYLYNFKKEHTASDRYIESIRVTLNGFFVWMTDNGYITSNPCRNVESIRFEEKQQEPLSGIELESIRWDCQDIREKALIDFLFSTGCRISECANVKLSDIDWEARSVFIRKGKGKKQRIVYFNAESEFSLKKYLESRNDDNNGLFVSVKAPHKAIGSHALENIVGKVAKRTGIYVHPHKLRRTFATYGLKAGMPLEKLQKLMGHANPKTTLIYAKQFDADIQIEHQRVYA